MEGKTLNKGKFVILDGAMGTMLQKAGLPAGARPESLIFTSPELLVGVHKAYVDAGADIVCSNTFGANGKKLEGSGYSVEDTITGAIACARKACEGTDAKVALDVGPLGELLEPAGTLRFEEAYDLFKQVMLAGEKAGADFIYLETMTDLYEVKAAVLAAKENTKLPIFASMTFEPNGRTFAGVSIEAFAATIGPLGVAALGINCSLGPAEIMPLAAKLCKATALPVLVKPNAGLPDPATGSYSLTPEIFCEQMAPCLTMGVSAVGGCCGTTPDTIALLKKHFAGAPSHREVEEKSQVCSATTVQVLDGVHPVGERINPTGKKRLQEALRNGDLAYLQAQAVAQEEDGAAILDVNVGAPGIDEVEMLPLAVKAVQAVTGLPLQLDSANPAALEAALRVYNGKAIVNSTSGEKEKLETILPLCKKYGAAVVGLTLDENGIPKMAQGRLAVAEKIVAAALEAGIPRQDIYIDCLTLTVSAEPDAAKETLLATRLVKEKLGVKTLLGVSNISFGLPNRPLVNTTFLTLAMQAGLDLPIMNPADGSMMGAIAAYRLLNGQDPDATGYLARFGGEAAQSVPAPATGGTMPLDQAIEKGLKAEAGLAAKQLLQVEKKEGIEVVNGYLMPALDRVGVRFEKGTLFLPQLLAAAGAAQVAFEEIKASYGADGESGPPIVLATVRGDVHDIGKNIVRVLLENYGYNVIDLGRDVPEERVVEAVRASGAKLVGLSALMTTTLPAMEATIVALRAAGLDCKVMVGGAVLTPEYAMKIGADFYSKDAKQGIDIAREIYSVQ